MITFTNDYHNTAATCRTRKVLSCRAVKRIRRELCGISDCKCAQTVLGTRGRQNVEIQERQDGSVMLSERPSSQP
jgi:hypothetical protein